MSWKPNAAFLPAFRAALGEYAAVAKKDNPEGIAAVMKQSAARIVKNIVDITPPASGKADASAKKRGEGAIVADLLRIAQPVQADGITRAQRRELFTSADELLAMHAKAAKTLGRVSRHGGRRVEVDMRDFTRVAAILGKRVGWLAAGLNAAASQLGVRLPGWVTRHGNKYGIIKVEFSESRFRIAIGNNVPYADVAKDYARKFDFAFRREVGTLQRMIKAISAKAHSRARSRLPS
jgi:hypothetical protein